jgi:3-methyladenine DNA glycosylase/8-oxoguanine DNA glycosylase
MVARFTKGAWWRAVRTPRGPATLAINGRERDRVLVRVWGEGSEWVCERAECWIGMADRPEDFVTDHPLVKRIHHLNPGFRFGSTGLVSEALWAAIAAQRVTGREAARSMRSLAGRWGERAPGPPVGVRLLPHPGKLATLGYYDLHPLGLERRRAVTLLRVAQWHDRIEKTANLPSLEARSFLEQLPGVGKWSSAKTVAVSHGDADAVAVGDYHLKNVVAWHLTGRPRGTDEEMMELLEPFRPHRGRVVRLLEKTGKAPRFGPRMPLRDFRYQ